MIARVEEQVKRNTLEFSTVEPVGDFYNDPRLSLSGVHIPTDGLKAKVRTELIEPLRVIQPEHHYYESDCLHLTVKSVRTANDPPRFTDEDISKAREVFSRIVPKHRKFHVFFYRLLFLPHNLALVGTTDEELDHIIFDLDRGLIEVGVPDDKQYANDKYFFSNMTLARFTESPSDTFRAKVAALSDTLRFDPYVVDSITLLVCDAVFQNRCVIGTWGSA